MTALIVYGVLTGLVSLFWVGVWFKARWATMDLTAPFTWLPDLVGGTLAIAVLWPVLVGYLLWCQITGKELFR